MKRTEAISTMGGVAVGARSFVIAAVPSQKAKSQNHCRPIICASLTLIAAVTGLADSIGAQEVRRFTNPGVGDWDVSANWQSGAIPNATTNVYIDSGGTAQVTTPNPQGRFVYLGSTNGQSGTLEILSGGRLTALNILTAGDSAAGTLIVHDGGTLVSGPAAVGGPAGMPGTATIDGPDATWQASGAFFVGGIGGGALNLINGGNLELAGSLYSGLGLSDSTGVTTVDGVGSSLSIAGLLWVGYQSGQGQVMTQNGGFVSALEVDIAQSGAGQVPLPMGSATVAGLGSEWTIANHVRVGTTGAGTLQILDGGRVSSASGGVAVFPGSTGTVTVGGEGSLWQMTGALGLGGDATSGASGGIASLTIQPGGEVIVGEKTVLFSGSTLFLDGGVLTTDRLQFQGGAFNWASGTLHVGTAAGPLVNQGGMLAPGISVGTTSIVGSYTQQAAGALAIELGGAVAGVEHDVVNIGGDAVLDGQLRLALINGYAPATDSALAILSSGTLSGEFINAAPGQRLSTADGLGSFLVSYGASSTFAPNQVVLSEFQFAADVNGDGAVDGEDLAAWQMGFGMEDAGRADGDVNGDQVVDGADLLAWQQQLEVVEGVAIAVVPEPVSVTVLLLAVISLGGLLRKLPPLATCG